MDNKPMQVLPPSMRALGKPAGSIRAMITLALTGGFILVCILEMFLVSENSPKIVEALSTIRKGYIPVMTLMLGSYISKK